MPFGALKWRLQSVRELGPFLPPTRTHLEPFANGQHACLRLPPTSHRSSCQFQMRHLTSVHFVAAIANEPTCAHERCGFPTVGSEKLPKPGEFGDDLFSSIQFDSPDQGTICAGLSLHRPRTGVATITRLATKRFSSPPCHLKLFASRRRGPISFGSLTCISID